MDGMDVTGPHGNGNQPGTSIRHPHTRGRAHAQCRRARCPLRPRGRWPRYSRTCWRRSSGEGGTTACPRRGSARGFVPVVVCGRKGVRRSVGAWSFGGSYNHTTDFGRERPYTPRTRTPKKERRQTENNVHSSLAAPYGPPRRAGWSPARHGPEQTPPPRRGRNRAGGSAPVRGRSPGRRGAGRRGPGSRRGRRW